MTREALRDDGVAVEIDEAVRELIVMSRRQDGEPAGAGREISSLDLIGALSTATRDVGRVSRSRKKLSKRSAKQVAEDQVGGLRTP